MEQLGKQAFAATDSRVTTEELLGTMFFIRCVQSAFKEEFG
jgi:hypothetical protein